mgnify:CR=1 FL=1|jgi:AcrR family transcriptional regulator
MAQNLKDQIIDAFIARFNEEGPALRLSEVATALHISKKTIYKVFPSKSSIYDTIIEKATAEIDARKEEIMTSSESTKEKLLDILTIKTSYEEAFNMPRLSELKQGEPTVYANLLKAYETSWASFVKLLEQGKKEGIVVQEANIPLIVAALTGAYQSLYKDDFLKKNHLTYTQAVREIAKLVLTGAFVR